MPPTLPPPPRRRVDRLAVLTWAVIALAVAAVLSEGIGLRDAGRRLRAQEAAEATARAHDSTRGR